MQRWQLPNKSKLWMFRWPLALILVAVITDYCILTKYFHFLTSEDQIKVITPLMTFNSILIAGAGIMYQVQATNERETQFKIHQQRKETYEEFLRILEKIFKMVRQNEKDFAEKIEDDWIKLRPKLIVYASPKVIEVYKAIEKAGSQKTDSALSTRYIAQLFLQIRSEVGFTGEDVPTRLLLSLFITDINESKYDYLFDRQGYLLPDKDTS